MSVVSNNILAGASGQGGAGGGEIKRSLRFNSGDSAYLNRTPSSVGNRKTFTLSAWVKAPAIANTQQIILSSSSGSTPYTSIDFRDNNLRVIEWDGSNTTYQLKTNAVLRDVSAWYHVVFAVDTTQSTTADRVKIYVNGVQETSFATANYPSQNHDTHINNSTLHYIGSNAATSYNGFLNCYLADVHFIDGQALAPTDFGETNTDNLWVPKAYGGTYGTNGFHLDFTDNSSNAALGTDTSGNSNDFSVYNLNAGGSTPNYTSGLSYVGFNGTTTFGGDGPGGVGAFDSSEAYRLTGDTSSGSGQTAIYTWVPPGGSISASSFKLKFQYFGTNSFGTTSVALNGGSYYTQGGSTSVTTYDFSSLITGGQITEVKVKWVSNQSGIGAHSWYGMWIDNVLLVDADPLGNDSLVDHPTNGTQTDTGAGGEVVGNYCTLNPLAQLSGTLSNGNLDYNLGSGTKFISGTIAVKSGKFYWEAKAVSGTTNGSVGGRFGFSQSSSILHGENGPFTLTWHPTGGIQTFISGSYAVRLTGTNYADGDTLGCALDADSNIAYFYKNGSLAYTYDFSSLVPAGSQFLTPSCWNGSSGTPVWTYNFGARAFAYSARTNHKCLNTANLPEPTIKDGSKYFDAKIYSGTGGTQSISGFGFSPDLVWVKNRTNAVPACLFDTVRGAGVSLETNNTDADTNWSNRVNGFNSDGFDTGNSNSTNGSSQNYVAWCFDESSSSGFDIVTYTGTSSGRSVGHSLGAAPEFFIVKNRDDTLPWRVYHKHAGDVNTFLTLNATDAAGGSSSYSRWSGTAPTSSSFFVGIYNDVNKNGDDYIAYCFAPVEGYSAMGSYVGNGSNDGPFIFTGMKPAFILAKISSGNTDDWIIYDTTRSTFNAADDELYPNKSDAETSGNRPIDILSNGFKIRNTSNKWNGASGYEYVYLAFASHPFASNGGLAR